MQIPSVPVTQVRHSRVLQQPLAAPRAGIMLHYDDSSRDDWALAWFDDPRCTNGYTWLALEDGCLAELADPGMRTPHAGACLTTNPNSRRADALDHALHLDRAARDSLSATIASYQATVIADTVRDTVVVAAEARSDALRQATFDVRDPPYTVRAAVELRTPPDTSRMALTVMLDTLELELRLGCGPANAAGVRPAVATVTAPVWASVRLERVEQAPELCASLGAADSRWAAAKRALSRIGLSAGYGIGVGAHNVAFSGVGVMLGVRLWP